jgi:hypothetical protein
VIQLTYKAEFAREDVWAGQQQVRWGAMGIDVVQLAMMATTAERLAVELRELIALKKRLESEPQAKVRRPPARFGACFEGTGCN